MHLEVVYSQNPLPRPSTGPNPERMEAYRRILEANNCTFEKAQVLPHNIGYLKLNSFPEPSICGATAKSAMATLNHADAIIFDLRENRGGYPSMVMLIAAYLFDHPEYMYRPGETTERCWTQSPVPGNRLADKPVYVLTSARTFSGAEHFSYDLKMLKRATLVGERTGGATDVGVFHRIDDHFGIGIRETRAINPYSEADWAVTGVEPDVKVKAADALIKAEELAQTKLQKK
jgi:C-terminal processing protease CtpA/Prc